MKFDVIYIDSHVEVPYSQNMLSCYLKHYFILFIDAIITFLQSGQGK